MNLNHPGWLDFNALLDSLLHATSYYATSMGKTKSDNAMEIRANMMSAASAKGSNIGQRFDKNCLQTMRLSANTTFQPGPLTTTYPCSFIAVKILGKFQGGGDIGCIGQTFTADPHSVVSVRPDLPFRSSSFVGERYQLEFFVPSSFEDPWKEDHEGKVQVKTGGGDAEKQVVAPGIFMGSPGELKHMGREVRKIIEESGLRKYT